MLDERIIKKIKIGNPTNFTTGAGVVALLLVQISCKMEVSDDSSDDYLLLVVIFQSVSYSPRIVRLCVYYTP
jgi:hypothetical protein